MPSVIKTLIKDELKRQEGTINLIASENYASQKVLAAAGSVLTNKYAEGYSGKRYYGGCQVIDKIEEYAIDLAKKIFGADHANVQPHSGSTANFGVYFSILKPGDTILGMSLSAGGHLTHGHKINFSGTIFNAVGYGVNRDTEELDYEEIERLAAQHKPKLIIAGASAYSKLIDYKRLASISRKHNAKLLVDMAHVAGLIAAKLIPSPIEHADFVSTTTHKTLRGPRGGMLLCKSDYAQQLDKSIMPGIQGGPLMHIIAAKAVAFEECLQASFKKYQTQVIKNSKAMAKAFADLGYRIVSGGTETHLFLVDLRGHKNLDDSVTGRSVEVLLEQNCNIILNRNLVPFDTQSPTNPSGVRVGTPALTTRGFKEKDVIKVVELIDFAIKNRKNEKLLSVVKKHVSVMCKNKPIY
ncbi:MAG: Serine hydroxymethyltransferase [candidate division TM6 bacterium GW2011_GWF2_37_49]|nr:MAG: Serine hydroxymethyltransferase [candidate division TM6 bacterium GW2011_GWF2_37_49]